MKFPVIFGSETTSETAKEFAEYIKHKAEQKLISTDDVLFLLEHVPVYRHYLFRPAFEALGITEDPSWVLERYLIGQRAMGGTGALSTMKRT